MTIESGTKKLFRPLKAKLLFAVLTVSTLLASVVIFLNFYLQYNAEVKSLKLKIQQINESSIPAMNSAVWNVDIAYLTVQVESIVKIEDIVSISIVDPKDRIIIERHNENFKNLSTNDFIYYQYPLHHKHYNSSKMEYIGRVEIIATISNIKNSLFDRILYFIIAQLFKTFLLAWIILLIFHHYINKNIEQIVRYSRNFNLNSISNKYLTLKRKTFTRDEFDILQDSINTMIKKINDLNTEKEIKITEQEKKIEIQQMNAINNSKLVALGEMAGGVAHEINNPLAIIQSHVQLMEKMIEKDTINKEQFTRSTAAVLATVERLKNIVKGLRNISRDATSEVTDLVSLKTIFSDVISLCEERFKNHQVELLFDAQNPTLENSIHCRQVQLSQVLLNLLNNSFDAVSSLKEKWIKIEVKKENKLIKINIIDSGHGIPLEIREKIFQPFYTTKPIGHGTGLGLSLVHRMISDHGGTIYYNEECQNTCFTIELPAV